MAPATARNSPRAVRSCAPGSSTRRRRCCDAPSAARPPLPTVAPNIPLQLIHEADVGRAFLQCIVAAGPPGAYNIAGDGVLTGATAHP